MFDQAALAEGTSARNRQVTIPTAIGGLNGFNALAAMPPKDAPILENWMPYADRLEMRYGCANHVTGFTKPVLGLHAWDGPTSSKLFATCDDGIFDATIAGAVGAAVAAITNGKTLSSALSTGGANYIGIVNGTDNISIWDGAVWTAPAAFGGLATNTISGIETYKQRWFFLKKNTLDLYYMPVNSVAGAATAYPLGAIFRRGGYLAGIATWTLDGGNGPDDNLVVVSSVGEVAVFSGTDPSAAATWSLKGVYYIGRPVGGNPLYKFGGDILAVLENGIYPISKALLVASIDRTSSITLKVQALYSAYVGLYSGSYGWQLIHHPTVPMLVVNIPGPAQGVQLVMNAQSGAWTLFSGWVANCFARVSGGLYFGSTDKVVVAWTGTSDYGNNIVATGLQAFNNLGYSRTKHIRAVRQVFTANGAFTYIAGVANDFSLVSTFNTVQSGAVSASLWGTGLWGTAMWSGQDQLTRDWRTVPDRPGVYKALYFQVSSKSARVALESTDLLFTTGGTF